MRKPLRSNKYLNAREYAERLYLSDNREVQEFALAFMEAIDAADDDSPERRLEELEDKISEFTENKDEGTSLQRLQWLNDEAVTLAEMEEKIQECCPEYEDMTIEDIIPDILKRLQPKPALEYDL
jgi:hypothetical protein